MDGENKRPLAGTSLDFPQKVIKIEGLETPGSGPLSAPPSISGRGDSHRSSQRSTIFSSEEDARSQAYRGRGRGYYRGGMRRPMPTPAERADYVPTRPKDEAGTLVPKKGSMVIPVGTITKVLGEPVPLVANYFRMHKVESNLQIFMYQVDFTPEIEVTREKGFLLGQHAPRLPWHVFNGSIMFTLDMMPVELLQLESKRKDDDTPVVIQFQNPPNFVDASHPAAIIVYNSIMKMALASLNLDRIGSDFFSSQNAVKFDSRKLDVWPGFKATMRQHEDGLLMCVNAISKVIPRETVLHKINEMRDRITDENRLTAAVEMEVVGAIVMTKYNGKTYRIDSVKWDENPATVFEMGPRQIQYRQYILERYGPNFKCQQRDQPMLYSKSKKRDIRRGMPEFIALIPEFCIMTGLSDEQVKDFGLMRELSVALQLDPDARAVKYYDFVRMLQGGQVVQKVFCPAGLALSSQLVELQGNQYYPETIEFGKDRSNNPVFRPQDANRLDWAADLSRAGMKESQHLQSWAVVAPQGAGGTEAFYSLVRNKAHQLHFMMDEPIFRLYQRNSRGPTSILEAIDSVMKEDRLIKLVMILLATDDESVYAAIKRKCCHEYMVASQCVRMSNVNVSRGRESKLQGVATKVAIQINAKLGGIPWQISIPFKQQMIVGFDVSTQGKSRLAVCGKTYGALVATTNDSATKYFSQSFVYDKDEFPNTLCFRFKNILRNWYTQNSKQLPRRIIFYRDGVSEGQLQVVNEQEVTQLREAINNIYTTRNQEKPFFGFIVVNKRPGARLFVRKGQHGYANPLPGTIVDDVITYPERYDFLLISAKGTGQGTVTPVSYNVICDELEMTPTKIHVLTQKLSYLYFNWNSCVRVPSVCQYARKLAFLQQVMSKGQGDLEYTIDEVMANKLYYL